MRHNNNKRNSIKVITQYKDISKSLTCKKLKRRISSLKKLDLEKINEPDICDLINKSFAIQIDKVSQMPSDKAICRGRKKNKEEEDYKPFDKVEDISYHKTPTKYGRCNLVGKPVFYGAMGLDTAVCEVCGNQLNRKNNVLYMTIGEWKLTRTINVNIICHSKLAHKRTGDLKLHYDSVIKLRKSESKSKSEMKQWKAIGQFLSNEFSKRVSEKEEFEYKISAIYSHSLLKSNMAKEEDILGLVYPSVACRQYEDNVVYNTEVIDNGILELQTAHYVKATYAGKNRPPQIEIISSTNNIQNGVIVW